MGSNVIPLQFWLYMLRAAWFLFGLIQLSTLECTHLLSTLECTHLLSALGVYMV
jgi:hypothetical protein